MGYIVKCFDMKCGGTSHVGNIVDLIKDHIDAFNMFGGYLRCSQCGKATGYIEKDYALQERGEHWNPIIRGVIKLGDPLHLTGSNGTRTARKKEDTYQPFVFLVCYNKPTGRIADCWFCYYKDTRGMKNGRLKQGHGPGGPPVLGMKQIEALMAQMARYCK